MSHLALFNIDEKYDKLPFVPFIANQLPLASDEDKKAFNELVYTHYDGESLKLTPSCECGRLHAEYRLGELCNHCGTYCSTKYSGKPESLIWILPPPGIDKLILPAVWIMLNTAYKKGSFETILWLTDPYYRSTKRVPDSVRALIDEKGHKRGYKYFIDNFFQIIDDLSFKSNGKQITEAKIKAMYTLIQQNKDRLFAKALPVPSKTILVLEKNRGDRYFDTKLLPSIDAVIRASEMGHLPPNTSLSKLENKTVNIIDKLATFFKNFSQEILTGKPGVFRKHYFAGRLHFSARQVITSLSEPHRADELVLPWSAAVKLFTEHIRSILLKPPYNMGLYEITDKLRTAINNYDPIIDEVLNKIILHDTPYKGFPCLFSRAPILTRGSIQFFYITGFMKDPSINTIRLSPLVLVMPNADFDGDAMHLTLILDKAMHDACKVLAPSYTILEPNIPDSLSNAIKMPAPVIGTVNNWFLEGDKELMEYYNENAKLTSNNA